MSARFGALFILSIFFSRFAFADTFLLSKPVEQKINLPRWALASTWAVDTSVTLFQASGVFLITGDPISTAGYLSYGLATGVPSVNAEVRVLNNVTATWKNRENYKKIASLENVEGLKLLRTGFDRQTGIYSSELQSMDFVFVETAEGKFPPATELGEWIPIKDIESAKIQFSLYIENEVLDEKKLEISLKTLFSESKVDQETIKSWRESVQSWSKKHSLWEKFFRAKEHEKINIQASLFLEGNEIPLGDYSRGKGVSKLLGDTLFQKFVALVKGKEVEGPNSWKTKDIKLLNSGGCSTWYHRAIGKAVLVKP
ncbi:MAG: hypothetical protein M9962_12120 [Oligoflexia bacterium]|nr:hypothetical protein [Oligoflexia bacterium]